MSGGCFPPCLQVMRVLTQRVDHLREEEAHLARLCEEKRKQSAPETGLAEGKLREVHVYMYIGRLPFLHLGLCVIYGCSQPRELWFNTCL